MPSVVGDKVAVIPLNGLITAEGASFIYGQVITPDLVREQLNKAEGDRAVKAIVLRIESPGGAVAPCQEILEEIEKVKGKKPIVVSMGSEAASGGYYISAKANRIVALPGTLTGSIGVISQIPNIKGLYEKLGIEMQTFKSGKYKDMYSGFRELTPEEKEIMQRMTDEYYEQFVEVVAEGRGMSKEAVKNLATGQLYTGAEAEELGLVDELGGLDRAIDVAAELAGVTAPRVEYYKPAQKSLLELLLGMNLSTLRSAIELKLLGLSGQDVVLLETLSHTYPQPQYLASPIPLP
jgi:protease-4